MSASGVSRSPPSGGSAPRPQTLGRWPSSGTTAEIPAHRKTPYSLAEAPASPDTASREGGEGKEPGGLLLLPPDEDAVHMQRVPALRLKNPPKGGWELSNTDTRVTRERLR